MGTYTLSGTAGLDYAELFTKALGIGTHAITAIYSGDNADQPSTSPTFIFTVAPEASNDYDASGHIELAIFRPSAGQWIVRGPSGDQVIGTFGAPDLYDIPVPGDYDNIGRTEMAVFHPSTGQWIVRGPSGD